MAVAYQTFIDRWPQFYVTSQTLAQNQSRIEREITLAAREVNLEIWGDHAQNAIMLLAAHQLVMAPGGQFARLASKDGSSTYRAEYDRLESRLLIGERVF